MIKQIGTKIYYCNITGNVIKIIGDMQGFIKETNFEEDYEIYQELKERYKQSIGLIQLKHGEYSDLSKKSTGVKVNLATKKLEFTYDPLPEVTPEPNIEDKVNTQQEEINNLKKQNVDLENALVELASMVGGA